MKFPKPNVFFSLWLMLALALAAFVWFSFEEEHDFRTPKKASFKSELLKQPVIEEESPAEIVPDSLLLEEDITISGPDTTVRRLLLFGDSMTILVANRMAYYGAQNGYDIYSVTWYSSSTKVWGECDTLSYFIKEYNPDFIIVTLGSNELFIRNIDERSVFVDAIKKQIGKIPFVWIGPPNWKEDTGINDMIERNIPTGTFFRTDGMKLARGSDNVHPTQKAADIWADSIMRWMPDTPHPILSAFPDTIKGKPKHTRKLLSPPK